MDNNRFDILNYSKSRPLAFENLADMWLKIKRQRGLKKSSFKNLKTQIHRAVDHWGSQNIHDISALEIQSYLLTLSDLSSKSQHNHLSTLREFWRWVSSMYKQVELPAFPTVRVKLGWRKTISKETQKNILLEIRRTAPYKVWIGIKFLCTYFNVRPGELVAIAESDIELDMARIWIRNTKEGEAKYLFLLDEDVKLPSRIASRKLIRDYLFSGTAPA